MIKRLVDFALRERLLVSGIGILLLIWGAFSFYKLPVEAYPDVANTWVQVITQWPGRAAEEVEQQVTIPIEAQTNGVSHLQKLRSVSLFGLSVVSVIFDDDADNPMSRQQVLEKLSQMTWPAGLNPTLGPDYSPVGQIYLYTVKSTNSRFDVTELKAIEDWELEKRFNLGGGLVSFLLDGVTPFTQNVTFPAASPRGVTFATFSLPGGDSVQISTTGLSADRTQVVADGGGLVPDGTPDEFSLFVYRSGAVTGTPEPSSLGLAAVGLADRRCVCAESSHRREPARRRSAFRYRRPTRRVRLAQLKQRR